MKGQTINFRKKDGNWVSGFFVPDTSTQVSLNSRKYFNYCRNDSSSVKDALAWDQCVDEDLNYVRYRDDYRNAQMSRTAGPQVNRYYQDDSIREDAQDRRMTESMKQRAFSGSTQQMPTKINITNYVETERQKSLERQQNKAQAAPGMQSNGSKQSSQKLKRSQSVKAKDQSRNDSIMQKARQSRQAKLAKLNIRKEKSAQRLKVEQYVKSLVPYTRDLPNSRFRTFYGKECMETYGKNNINEPIGGIIYGNHMKTFNIGPHSHGNDPEFYQTHNTALNFAKRTKLNEEDKWRRLEKEMGKKLGLKVVNNSVKEGKQLNIQEVNDDNMYAIMKQNHEFQKQHKDQIRTLEKEYQKDKADTLKAEAEEYKQQRIADRQSFKVTPLATKSQAGDASTAADGMSMDERLKNQVIYKYTDENGVTRYATDRHSITCYVDLNFPENEAVYTQELINRSPIFPIEVREKDRHLDEIRKQNYVDSVVNCYPAHYLTPNVDYSQVKWGKHAQEQQRKRSRSKSKSLGKQTVGGQRIGGQMGGQSLGGQGLGGRRQAGQDGLAQRSKSPGINEVRGQQAASIGQRALKQDGQQRQIQFADQIQSGREDVRSRQQSQPRLLGVNEGSYGSNYDNNGCGCSSARPGCGPNIKQVLLQRAERDPHLASKLLSYSRKYDCELNNNQPTQLIENDEYDPNNYYPHAAHELNPQLYSRVSPDRIPYAGLSSTKNRLP